jgi:hypothetical protein
MAPISSSVKTCLVAAGDFVEQCSRRAAVGALVAVPRGQVGADERLEARPIGSVRIEAMLPARNTCKRKPFRRAVRVA